MSSRGVLCLRMGLLGNGCNASKAPNHVKLQIWKYRKYSITNDVLSNHPEFMYRFQVNLDLTKVMKFPCHLHHGFLSFQQVVARRTTSTTCPKRSHATAKLRAELWSDWWSGGNGFWVCMSFFWGWNTIQLYGEYHTCAYSRWFRFFLNFHPPKPWGIHDPIWLSSAYFWQMGGEKNHQRKDEIWIRAIQKPKPYRIGWWDFQIFHNLLGSKGREAKCPAGRRTFPQPRCSTCELLSGRVRMSPVVPRSPTSPLVTLLRWKL